MHTSTYLSAHLKLGNAWVPNFLSFRNYFNSSHPVHSGDSVLNFAAYSDDCDFKVVVGKMEENLALIKFPVYLLYLVN